MTIQIGIFTQDEVDSFNEYTDCDNIVKNRLSAKKKVNSILAERTMESIIEKLYDDIGIFFDIARETRENCKKANILYDKYETYVDKQDHSNSSKTYHKYIKHMLKCKICHDMIG